MSSPNTRQKPVSSQNSRDWLKDAKIFPRVSVVIPMYNEEQHISACLHSVLSQNYHSGKLEIQVVDGDSDDGSVRVVQEQFIAAGAPVKLSRNPYRKTPQSFNIGLRASIGEVIIILSAHAEMQPGFIAINVENLRRENIYCCGGTLVSVGETPIQISIGVAMSHPFVLATSQHRYRRKPGYMKTAVFGAYRREIFDTIGYFEEEGMIAEDAELNWRIIQAGHKIYYDPRIKSYYYPRRTLRSLAQQMFKYGILRVQMYRKHNQGLSWLHFVPPIFVLTLLGLAIGGTFSAGGRSLLYGLILIYGSLTLGFSMRAWWRNREARLWGIVGSFVIVHVAWGTGFLMGMFLPRTKFREYVRQSKFSG